jgi:hypothetical protein
MRGVDDVAHEEVHRLVGREEDDRLGVALELHQGEDGRQDRAHGRAHDRDVAGQEDEEGQKQRPIQATSSMTL